MRQALLIKQTVSLIWLKSPTSFPYVLGKDSQLYDGLVRSYGI